MVFGESRSKDRARKRAAGKLLSVLLTVAMVLQGSPFAYAEEILAAMEQEDAVTPAVVEEPAAEGPVAEDATEESVAEDATEEAAPAEAEAVAIEGQGEADAESEPAEAVAAKTEYVYEDDTLKVTAKLDDAAAIPDDAQLMVTAITAESDKYNYDAYMTALNEGGQPKANGQNTMLYDVAFLVYAEDGTATEVQPTVGSVHVTFDFKKAQLESIGVEDSEQVSVTHLPLVDSAKADTTAQATNITPNDVIVEDVETAQVNVDADTIELQAKQFSVFAVGYTVDFTYDNYTFSIEGKSEILLSVLFTELGIDADVTKVTDVSFSDPELVTVSKQDGDWLLASKKAFKTTERLTVTMLSGATYEIVVTDAQDRTAKVQLFDDDACEIPATDTGLASDNAFCIVATLLDKDEKVLGYNYDWVNASDLQNHEWVFSDGDFKGLDESGNPTGGTVAYDEAAKHTIRLRMYRDYIWHWQTNYLDLIGLPDTVNGYIFKDALVDGTTTTLRLRKGFPAEYQVKVTIDPSVTSADLEGLKLYAEAQHQSTGKDWYEGALPAADTVLVLYDPARDPKSQWTQNPGGDFSGNETTRAYVNDASGNRIPSGSYINGLVINYPKKTVVEDETSHETQYTDYVHITRIDKFEPAIDPYDVLGEGAEYGVVADTFIRHDHTETNFAVNHYDESQTAAGIDLAANGGESEAMPFYVGDYSRIHFTGNTTVDPDIYAPSKRDSSYIHTAADEAEDRIHQDAYTYDVTVIPTSVSDVKSYVDGLIEKLSSSSSTYKDKPSITAEPGKVLDTTQLPDNVTIYVDASNLNTNETGWEIKKLEGQSIVLNIPGKNVTINKEVVHVYSKDDSGNPHLIKTVDANTNGNGGDKAHNKDVEDHILNHIVFNAYEAESVEFVSGPAGLFLAPNATFKENSGSGTGWVATGKTFIQHSSEWHFFRTQRKYKAKGDLTLKAQKKLTDASGNVIKYEDKGFEFELYEADDQFNPAKDAEGNVKPALDTETADADGFVEFKKLKYDHTKVPAGETRAFYYVIKEVIPPDAVNAAGHTYAQASEEEKAAGGFVKDGIEYKAEDIKVMVKATAPEEGSGSEEITFEVTANGKKIEDTGTGDEKVFEIGEFKNSKEQMGSLKITKNVTVAGQPVTEKTPASLKNLADGTYKFEVYKGESATGNPEKSVELTITNGVSSTQLVEELEPGKYTIKEVAGGTGKATLTDPTSGIITVDVAAGKTGDDIVVASFTNSYAASGQLVLSGTKEIESKPESMDLSGFKFTVKEGGETVATGESDAQGKITFDAIAYPSIESVGEHTYEVTEDASPTKPGVTNSTSTVTVKVNVADDGEGGLVATATEDSPAGIDAVNFTNSYEAKGNVTFEGTKKIEGRDLTADDKFTFTVTEGDTLVAEVTNDATGKIAYPTIEYVKNKDKDETGLHTYTVKETSTDGSGITVDTTTYTVTVDVQDVDHNGALTVTPSENYTKLDFTNSYEAKGNVTFEGTKKIEGRDLTADDKFTFTVTEGDTLVAEVTNDATGKIAYPTIEYVKNKDKDETGLHTYTVKETSTDGSGITVDTTTYTVTVDVQDVDHNGALTVTPSENYTKLDFTNAYEAKGSITLEGTKTIDTREIAEGETFSFEIRDNKGTVVSKGKSDGKKITFEPIEYVKNKDKDQTGTFTYSVVETSADGKGITTDKKSHKAVVKVTDNGKGELVVELVEDKSDINFVNKYDAAGSFQIAGLTKVLKNGELKAKQFSFQLKDADGKVLQTAYNDDSGNITFSAISYTLADLKGAASKKFSYTVNEVVPAGATKNADGTYTAGGITYSGDVVSFEVTVSDNGDGTLKIEGAEGGKVDLKHVFVNSQQEKKQAEKKKLAKTSDLANPGLMAGIAGAGLAIVVIGLINRRRRRDQ